MNTAMLFTEVPGLTFVHDIDVLRNGIFSDRQILLAGVEDSRVNENVNIGSSAGGIFLAGGVERTDVSSNYLRNGADDGIRSRDAFAFGPNQDNTITRNDIRGFGFDGLSFANGTIDNYVYRNESRNNDADGLRAEQGTADNRFIQNTMLGNGEHDCHDDTVGPYPPGVANLWRGNIGNTENRPGLCREEDDDDDDDESEDESDDDDD